MSLEAYLNEQINASSEGRGQMFARALYSEDPEMQAVGLQGLVTMGLSHEERHEDFALWVDEPISDDRLQEMISQYFSAQGYEVTGDCHSWDGGMKLHKTGEMTKSVTVSNDSSAASKQWKMKGVIYVTVADWPWDD